MLLIVQMIYKVLYPDFKDSVAHCIDDLETKKIDGYGIVYVVHRIDDLEMIFKIKHPLCFCLSSPR